MLKTKTKTNTPLPSLTTFLLAFMRHFSPRLLLTLFSSPSLHNFCPRLPYTLFSSLSSETFLIAFFTHCFSSPCLHTFLIAFFRHFSHRLLYTRFSSPFLHNFLIAFFRRFCPRFLSLLAFFDHLFLCLPYIYFSSSSIFQTHFPPPHPHFLEPVITFSSLFRYSSPFLDPPVVLFDRHSSPPSLYTFLFSSF